jgi:general secretion pathway protein L
MSEQLVIRLKGAPDPTTDLSNADVEWLFVEGVSGRRGHVHVGLLAEVAPQSVGRTVIVLVPGTDILLAEPIVPIKSGVKVAQVVPFALEEQLGSDVDDLHFAVGKRDRRPGTPVAVASHARMEAWLAALQNAGIETDTLYPETALLPITPNSVTLVIEGSRVYVRREETPSTVLDVQPLLEALQLALTSGEEAREHVTIYINEIDYERERELLEEFREFTASLQLKLLTDGALPLFAINIPNNTPVNLLQGKYAVKKQLNVSFAPWRQAVIMVAVCVVLHFGLKGWQYFYFKQQVAKLDQQIVALYQQTLPLDQQPTATTARQQMAGRLASLSTGGSSSGGEMLATLGALSVAVSQNPGTDIQSLIFNKDSTTDLLVLAPSVEILDRIQNAISEHGMKAEIQQTNPRDSKIEGRLKFTKAGA